MTKTAGTVKVRKRVLTQARREQNRLNQRAYRQRQRTAQSLHSLQSPSAPGLEEQRPPSTHPGMLFPLPDLSSTSQLANADIDSLLSDWSSVSYSSSFEDLAFGLEHGVFSPPQAMYMSSSMPVTLPSTSNHIATESSPNGRSVDHNSVRNDIITAEGFDLERVIAAGIETLLYESTFQSLPPPSSPSSLSPPRLPDPWAQCIHFARTHILLACIHNAQSMGFDVHETMMPKTFASSPYYRPITSTDDPKKLLASVASPSTPADLKPSLPQLLYPHPAFMDLIPIPTFRAHAITLLATQPPVIDMHELKRDVAIENGISYWSNSSSRSEAAARSTAQGQPWDIRGWEVAPWFLRKWRMLFGGGEEGEMWKQSLWWQRARGEEVSYIEE